MSSSCVRMLDSRSSAISRRPPSAQPRQQQQRQSSSDSPPTTFSKVSPIHGVGRVSSGSLPVRAFYIGLVIVAIITTIVFVAFLLEDIINNPSTVTRKVKSRSTLDLPTVIICNLNPVRLSYLSDFEQYVETTSTDDSDSADLYYGSGEECTMCVDGQLDPTLFRQEYSKLPKSLKSVYGHQLSDMLLSCQFRGQTCSSSDFTTYVDDYYGNCFSFNSRSANESGSWSGLTLELDVEIDEYVPYVSETKGFRVLLEPQPTASCSRSDDLTISPGQDNFLALKSSISTGPCAKNYVSVSAGVWPTSANKSNSLFSSTDATTSISASTASQSSVSTTSPPDLDAVDTTVAGAGGGGGGGAGGAVGIVDPIEYYDTHQHLLSKREADTLKNDNNNNNNRHKQPSSNHITETKKDIKTNRRSDEIDNETVKQNYYRSWQTEVIDNTNDMDVQSTYYYLNTGLDIESGDKLRSDSLSRVRRSTGSSGDSSTESDSEAISQARERFSKMRVYYSSMDEEVESESQVYPWYVATALIGGQLALLCSISAIAIVEGIECFFRFIGRHCQKLQSNNKVGIGQAWE